MAWLMAKKKRREENSMESEKVKEIKKVYSTWKMTFHGITNTDILTLINELESENKELKKYKLDWLNGEKMHLQAEMEETEFELYCANKSLKEVREENQQLKDRLAELEDKIENGTLKEVVRCKDCVYFQPEYVEMENGEKRPYTEEEIKNGKCVTMEKGINCGSRCERFRYWKENQYPVWFNENAFCSYGKPKKIKELKGAK